MATAALHPLFDTPLPDDWKLLTVDDIKSPEKASCVAGPFGSNISSRFFVESGVPVIRGGNLRDDLTRFVHEGFVFVSKEQATKYKAQHVRACDLVFTCWGTIGQVGLIPEDGPFPEYIISNKQLKLRPNLEIADPLYLFFYFAGPKMVKHVLGKAIGAAVPGINLGILKELPVVLPPLAEQRRIAGILSAYDKLIENSQRRIRLLEAMARALYHEWFVQFRFPGHEKLPRVVSSLGDIPQGWEVKTIADLCESVSYGYTARAAREEVGPKFLRITDIVPELIDWAGVPFCEIPEDKVQKYLLKDGDIVVARTGATTGYAKRLNKHHPDTVFASYLVRARAKAGLSNRMLGIVMESHDYKQYIKTNIGGAAQPQANAVVLTSMRLAVPPSSVGEKFDRLVAPMMDEAELLAVQIQNLRRTRDLLLPRLLSGQVELSATNNTE